MFVNNNTDKTIRINCLTDTFYKTYEVFMCVQYVN